MKKTMLIILEKIWKCFRNKRKELISNCVGIMHRFKINWNKLKKTIEKEDNRQSQLPRKGLLEIALKFNRLLINKRFNNINLTPVKLIRIHLIYCMLLGEVDLEKCGLCNLKWRRNYMRWKKCQNNSLK